MAYLATYIVHFRNILQERCIYIDKSEEKNMIFGNWSSTDSFQKWYL